jgi:hypothetical protein
VEAMSGRPPIYHGETIEGFCGLCNHLQPVTARFYFVCPFCWNVLVAHQKSFVACSAVHDYWKKSVAPNLPMLRLTETEVPYLSPYARAKKSKKVAAEELQLLDFIVEEGDDDGTYQPLFHIELKAGPGNIDVMSEFQLDINDSNDIIGAVNKTQIPAYVFHVQLLHEYHPPTRRTVAAGMWFTDIFTLLSNRRSVKVRRGEEKKAGYYSPSAFRPIDEFLPLLEAGHYKELADQLKMQKLEMT